jgi:hypothetical protein
MEPRELLLSSELEDEPCEGAEWQNAGFEGYSDEDDLRICDEIDKLQSRD